MTVLNWRGWAGSAPRASVHKTIARRRAISRTMNLRDMTGILSGPMGLRIMG
jgi:hypothetical protein